MTILTVSVLMCIIGAAMSRGAESESQLTQEIAWSRSHLESQTAESETFVARLRSDKSALNDLFEPDYASEQR